MASTNQLNSNAWTSFDYSLSSQDIKENTRHYIPFKYNNHNNDRYDNIRLKVQTYPTENFKKRIIFELEYLGSSYDEVICDFTFLFFEQSAVYKDNQAKVTLKKNEKVEIFSSSYRESDIVEGMIIFKVKPLPQNSRQDSHWNQTIADLYLNEHLSDVKLICDGQAFPSHKFILSCQSEVFKTMFIYPESGPEIVIDDVSAETMKSVLKFLYTDNLKHDEINGELLRVADKYNFKALIQVCVQTIEKKLNINNVTLSLYCHAFLSW